MQNTRVRVQSCGLGCLAGREDLPFSPRAECCPPRGDGTWLVSRWPQTEAEHCPEPGVVVFGPRRLASFHLGAEHDSALGMPADTPLETKSKA